MSKTKVVEALMPLAESFLLVKSLEIMTILIACLLYNVLNKTIVYEQGRLYDEDRDHCRQ